MFTGFETENTPAIKVWDFSNTFASTSAIQTVSLSDDCAPIQYFKTGGSTPAIRIYLPTAPIEGKTITICNSRFGTTNTLLSVLSSDNSGSGTGAGLYVLGIGQTKTLFFSKNFISYGSSPGQLQTGWISIDAGSRVSSHFASVNLGGNNNNASGVYSTVVGGLSNNATNDYACVVGGSGSTASGQYSGVFGGQSNTASNTSSVVVGGEFSAASGSKSGAFAGENHVVSAESAVAVGGSVNTASGFGSCVVGGRYGTARGIVGNFATSASYQPVASLAGASQTGTLILGRQTTDATATRLTSSTGGAATNNQVILPNNSAYTFQGTCIANVTAGGDTSGWKFEGVIKRGANAASTTLVAAVTPTVIAQDVGAVTWVLAVTADTTNGGIAVTVTGAAATTIRWVCKIETTEVTF